MDEMTGNGVIIAVIDSGIDYFLPDFRNQEGDTRLEGIYDIESETFYSPEMINSAISLGYVNGLKAVPIWDASGHGTGVAAIAAGTDGGIARQAGILAVKLGRIGNVDTALTTQLMRGVDYCIKYAVGVGKPIVINISYGNTYGDHKGHSILESFIDNASEIGKSSIVIGAGNEGDSNGHISGTALTQKTVELIVGKYETEFNLSIWKYYQDEFDISLISPAGGKIVISARIDVNGEALNTEIDGTKLMCYIGKPQPFCIEQEIYIGFAPQEDYVTEGVWQIVLTPVSVVTGEYMMYLSGAVTRNYGTGFANPVSDMTITIPATSSKSISVGAYDAHHEAHADFSGNGYVYRYGENSLVAHVKPDICAPGVDIRVPLPGGGSDLVSGTSYAAPYVSGVCALMMEWGIVKGFDRYMYGEKLKAYLISGSKPVLEKEIVPNSKIGWGKVDFLRQLL